MKKLLSIAAVAALLSIGAIADNTIDVSGEVLPSAVVGFADVSGETLGTDKFIDATINLGSHEVDAFNTDAATSKDIFVKTNIATGNTVTMAITSNNGDTLKDEVSGATIPVTYTVGNTALATDGTNPVTLANAANAGSQAITDKFTIATNAADDQLAGTYGATLTVEIIAN